MNVNMERVEENKMQQYREKTVELKQSLSSFHTISESISQPEQKSRTSLLESEDKNTQTWGWIQICTIY